MATGRVCAKPSLPTLSATPTTQRIDALLPQTQCGQCGYAGCLPYAEAIAAGRADINRCPPGGAVVISDLAQLLGLAAKPLDTRYGVTKSPAVARIEESWCIGCTLCIQACPVDAIVGAAKLMHTVIAEECTGCELCISPCPVACIAMMPVARDATRQAQLTRAAHARARFQARSVRLAQPAAPVRTASTNAPDAGRHGSAKKHAAIARAFERARARIKNI